MRTGPVGCGVAVVVRDGPKVLLIKRTGRHGEGTWSVPGGWIEPGEGPIEAARRELFEEVGLTYEEHPDRQWVLTKQLWSHNVFEGDDPVECITLWFKTDISYFDDPEPQIMEAHRIQAMGWFLVYRLPEPLFPPFEERVEKGLL